MVRAWVHKKLLKLSNTFQHDKYADYHISIQDGVPVGVKKLKQKKKNDVKKHN